jgi:hypothetical protein
MSWTDDPDGSEHREPAVIVYMAAAIIFAACIMLTVLWTRLWLWLPAR